jgi:alpha-D-xyloside xylohydrolase
MPQAVQLYKSIFTKQHINPGISGYKIDEVDGYDNWLWPDVASFPSGITHSRCGKDLPAVAKPDSILVQEKNIRTYGLVRGSNAGASSMPYVIYDDYYNHRDFITALCNSSFIGVLWTPEVRSSPTAEEWLRRMQAVCFSPMAMLNAWSDGTKPWTYPEVEQQVTAVANLRMQLLPYIYNAFAQYHFEGKPPVRAMNLADGFNYTGEATSGELNSVTNPYPLAIKQDIKDQFLLGDDLLVAPLFAGDKKRNVILPKGNWYDFYTGRMQATAK